jgi:hypothetical protein
MQKTNKQNENIREIFIGRYIQTSGILKNHERNIEKSWAESDLWIVATHAVGNIVAYAKTPRFLDLVAVSTI